MVKVLLNNVYYLKDAVYKGFIYFDENSIIEEGSEPDPEYELSELVYEFKENAFILHGFSVIVNPTRYLYRGFNNLEMSVFDEREIEKLVYSALYELIINGVTLPIIIDEKPEVVSKILFENGIKGVLIVDRGTSRRIGDNIYLEIDETSIYHEDSRIGYVHDLICRVDNFKSNCVFLDIREEGTWNLSSIIYYIVRSKGVDVENVIRVLTNPYRLLKIDSGKIEKGSKPDLLIYDLKNSFLTTPINMLKYVVLRGYTPDYVFLRGDALVEKREPLELTPLDLLDIVLKRNR
ncbi:MAG: hypothetical protein QXT88_02620 [Desulfurococcaceae archaeon]